MPDPTTRGHVNAQGLRAKADVTAASLERAIEGLDSSMPVESRGLEGEVIALRETMEELIFVLKLVNGL